MHSARFLLRLVSVLPLSSSVLAQEGNTQFHPTSTCSRSLLQQNVIQNYKEPSRASELLATAQAPDLKATPTSTEAGATLGSLPPALKEVAKKASEAKPNEGSIVSSAIAKDASASPVEVTKLTSLPGGFAGAANFTNVGQVAAKSSAQVRANGTVQDLITRATTGSAQVYAIGKHLITLADLGWEMLTMVIVIALIAMCCAFAMLLQQDKSPTFRNNIDAMGRDMRQDYNDLRRDVRADYNDLRRDVRAEERGGRQQLGYDGFKTRDTRAQYGAGRDSLGTDDEVAPGCCNTQRRTRNDRRNYGREAYGPGSLGENEYRTKTTRETSRYGDGYGRDSFDRADDPSLFDCCNPSQRGAPPQRAKSADNYNTKPRREFY